MCPQPASAVSLALYHMATSPPLTTVLKFLYVCCGVITVNEVNVNIYIF